MGCNGCSVKSSDDKSGSSCSTGGCSSCSSSAGKMPVFNWLSKVDQDYQKNDIVEVQFKNGRKGFFKNINSMPLYESDIVSVEGNPGYDIGTVSMVGSIVKLQMRRKKITADSDRINKLYRKATQQDIDKWIEARSREKETMYRTRLMASELKLKMKISDVEFQGDNTKATFYYTADDRVDFRELIKVMAEEFKIRIEMRQIGARQEAARLGGIGSCGRELCCSTWLSDFRSVNTTAARYQQLSLNPQKLAGQCGKLKCCLNYELDSYLDALKAFPNTSIRLKTGSGEASFQKMDIFKQKMWYTYSDGEKMTWIELNVEKVREIISKNKKGEIPDSIDMFKEIEIIDEFKEFESVVGQDSLNRFDNSNAPSKNKRRNQQKKKKARTVNSEGQALKSRTKTAPKNRSGSGPNTSTATTVKRDHTPHRRKAKVKSKPTGQGNKGQNKPKEN